MYGMVAHMQTQQKHPTTLPLICRREASGIEDLMSDDALNEKDEHQSTDWRQKWSLDLVERVRSRETRVCSSILQRDIPLRSD